MKQPKFPKCSEYGILKQWLEFSEDLTIENIEKALALAERTGELTGMRNQHKIEKKDRELAKEQGAKAERERIKGILEKHELLLRGKMNTEKGSGYNSSYHRALAFHIVNDWLKAELSRGD